MKDVKNFIIGLVNGVLISCLLWAGIIVWIIRSNN